MDLFVRTCNYEKMNVMRIIARGVVLLGVLVSAAAMLGAFAQMGYTTLGVDYYVQWATIPLAIAVVIFVIGLFFEVFAAVLLFAGAAAIVVWGLFAGWGGGLWLSMLILIVAPMLLSGVLYWMAAGTQKACSLDEATAPAEPTPAA